MTSQWGVTPRFGAGQTPMVGSMTPMHGVGSGRTPMYGSQTPQHGDGQLLYQHNAICNYKLASKELTFSPNYICTYV